MALIGNQREISKDYLCPLSSYLIPGTPPSMYYIPSFISESEETALLNSVYAAPLPQWRQLSHRRLQSLPSPLSGQNVLLDAPLPAWLQWPADRIAGLSLEDKDKLTNEDDSPRLLFADSPHKRPNHCLVNEYTPGQGIMPHEDGPAYHPITATVSLGSHAVLEVRMKQDYHDAMQAQLGGRLDESAGQTAWRILCEPRSLLVTTGEAYVQTLHAIQSVEMDEGIGSGEAGIANWDLLGDKNGWTEDGGRRARETRVSLTYRDVLKVRSLKAFGALKNFSRR